MVHHAGEGGLQPGQVALLLRRVVVPGPHVVVARRQLGAGRHHAQRQLLGQPALALHIPPGGKNGVVAADQPGRRLMRGMHCAQRQPAQPGRLRQFRHMPGQEADGLVHQVFRQVIALLRRTRRLNRRVVAHKFRRVLVRRRIHEAVEAVEPAGQRPAIERPGAAAFGQRGDVPLAQHVGAVAVRAQHFCQRPGFLADLAAIPGKTAVEVRQAANPRRVVVAPGQQRGAGGGAHRRGMEAGIAQPLGRQPVDRRRAHRGAEAAEVGEAGIVEQHQQDVRRTLGRAGWCRPVRLGRAAAGVLRAWCRCRHGFFSCRCRQAWLAAAGPARGHRPARCRRRAGRAAVPPQHRSPWWIGCARPCWPGEAGPATDRTVPTWARLSGVAASAISPAVSPSGWPGSPAPPAGPPAGRR